jgi:hypothetical protein
MKMQFIVMPAWIAGIQVRMDASGNIHVSLGSSRTKDTRIRRLFS